ncbi:hypothetical protein ACVR05_02815 [Streptococcus caprae]|uniref:Lipocalin/cytosolic fatty-acid binding domain-containing protein n=1 Tax=Streptococcus caprae TaxID=1640501 RepID=A0ABV8CY48_9STRE
MEKCNKSWTYYIHFKKGVTSPDLTTPVFQDYFTVEHVTEDGTVVITSKVNDTRLRKIISTESQLSLDAFHVTDHIIRMP